jgi:hypothetical protein
VLELFQDGENDHRKHPHGCELAQDFEFRRDALHESRLDVQRDHHLKNHDVTEVQGQVVNFLEDPHKLAQLFFGFAFEFWVFFCQHLTFFSCLNVKKNQENHRKYSQNGRVGEIIHKERFAHSEVSIFVESEVLHIRKVGLFIQKLVESHGVLQR